MKQPAANKTTISTVTSPNTNKRTAPTTTQKMSVSFRSSKSLIRLLDRCTRAASKGVLSWGRGGGFCKAIPPTIHLWSGRTAARRARSASGHAPLCGELSARRPAGIGLARGGSGVEPRPPAPRGPRFVFSRVGRGGAGLSPGGGRAVRSGAACAARGPGGGWIGAQISSGRNTLSSKMLMSWWVEKINSQRRCFCPRVSG